MSAVLVQHYIQRARDFFQAMQLLRDDGDYKNAAGLLAIHSAISYADALRVGLGDSRLQAESHTKSIIDLRNLLVQRRYENLSGVDHLAFLLSKKSAISYGKERFDLKSVQALNQRAERFAFWATGVGRKLNIGGWKDGDN
jgi:hypothetical protein